MFNCKFLERIPGDVISDMLVDVSKDETLFTFVGLSFVLYFKDISRRGFVKVISRDTISDMFSGTLTKASSGNSGLHYDVPGKSEKLLFV